MTVGERMKQRRKELGMNAEQVAKILNVSPSTIYRYENGDIEKMGIDKLGPIAKAIKTTPEYLMGWDSNANSNGATPLVNDDPELSMYLDYLKNRSECRMLFNVTKDATKEEVEAIVKFIEAIRKSPSGD